MARKSVEVRRCIDNCVKVVAHSQAKTLAAKAGAKIEREMREFSVAESSV